VRFLHTADWQLGMTRHFLSSEAQARYSEARLEAVRSIARLASQEHCAFVVVSGDVFESNHLDRQVVVRALDAMSAFGVPVYLLPGNHDPLGAASVYRSAVFAEHRPEHVCVLDSFIPVEVPGVDAEVVGAPWDSKQPLDDLAARACAALEPTVRPRVLVAHGALDTLSPNSHNPALIRTVGLEAALAAGLVHYVALGDRHSPTAVGDTGRIWYSGTPLVTDYSEVDTNRALVVDLAPEPPSIEPRSLGAWSFQRRRFDVNNAEEVDVVNQWLEGIPSKRDAVVKLSFVGTLSLADKVRLDEVLEHFEDLFAALETWERHTDLVVLPDEADLHDLGLGGFAAEAMAELAGAAQAEDEGAQVARDALGLLYRLAGSAS
jgi:DNA repair exonuclease SbcCD nuclease subunit